MIKIGTYNLLLFNKLSFYLSIFPCIYLSTYLSFHLSIFPSIYISICLSFQLSIFPSIYLFIFLSINLSIFLSIYLSLYLSFLLSIYLSIYLSRSSEVPRVEDKVEEVPSCGILTFLFLVYLLAYISNMIYSETS